jgi:hypothetical protein
VCVSSRDYASVPWISDWARGWELVKVSGGRDAHGIVKTRVSQASSLFASYRSLELGLPLHEPLILMHSVRGEQQRESSRYGIPEGSDRHLWQCEVEQTNVTTHDSGTSLQRTIHRQGVRKEMSSGSRFGKQACVGMTFLLSVSEGRSTLAASGSHVFDHVLYERTSSMFLIVVVASLFLWNLRCHRIGSPLVLGTITVKD